LLALQQHFAQVFFCYACCAVTDSHIRAAEGEFYTYASNCRKVTDKDAADLCQTCDDMRAALCNTKHHVECESNNVNIMDANNELFATGEISKSTICWKAGPKKGRCEGVA
jgi:hypothetical protein